MRSTRNRQGFATGWLIAATCLIAGVAWTPLSFAGALAAAGLALARRHRRLGCAVAFGMGFFLLVSGYHVGKDLAHRDQQVAAAKER